MLTRPLSSRQVRFEWQGPTSTPNRHHRSRSELPAIPVTESRHEQRSFRLADLRQLSSYDAGDGYGRTLRVPIEDPAFWWAAANFPSCLLLGSNYYQGDGFWFGLAVRARVHVGSSSRGRAS